MEKKKISNIVIFPTKYTERKRVFSEVGSRMQPTYKMHVDENGKRELRKVGEIDLYAQIQSYKDSVDINVLLQRFARGDESALSKIQGVYGDFTQMPKTYRELAQRVIDAENIFNQLPIDIRKEFNFSPSEFFSSIGSDKFNEIFKEPAPDIQPLDQTQSVPTEQVKIDEVQKGEAV